MATPGQKLQKKLLLFSFIRKYIEILKLTIHNIDIKLDKMKILLIMFHISKNDVQ